MNTKFMNSGNKIDIRSCSIIKSQYRLHMEKYEKLM